MATFHFPPGAIGPALLDVIPRNLRFVLRSIAPTAPVDGPVRLQLTAQGLGEDRDLTVTMAGDVPGFDSMNFLHDCMVRQSRLTFQDLLYVFRPDSTDVTLHREPARMIETTTMRSPNRTYVPAETSFVRGDWGWNIDWQPPTTLANPPQWSEAAIADAVRAINEHIESEMILGSWPPEKPATPKAPEKPKEPIGKDRLMSFNDDDC